MPEYRNEDGLTAEQMNAAAMLATGLSKDRVAKAIGVRKQTVVEWARDPSMTAEIDRLAEKASNQLVELANEARLGVLGLLPQVNTTLAESLDAVTPKGNPDWWARHKGAELLLKAAGMFGPGGAGATTVATGAGTNVAVVIVNADDTKRAEQIVHDVEKVIDVEVIEKEQEYQHSLLEKKPDVSD